MPSDRPWLAVRSASALNRPGWFMTRRYSSPKVVRCQQSDYSEWICCMAVSTPCFRMISTASAAR